MKRRSRKARFWTILTTVNIVAMLYPVSQYVQADNNDAQFFATIVLLGAAFLLAITDTISVLVAYLQ